jgi:meso-butanediol dehydrogenase/(S,S)-butanediol dehydrogenase/diacetyl reductase
VSDRAFVGKVVAVTGAASGLGRAAALAFADAGATLALADVAESGLEKTATLAREKGATVHAITLDVADAAACGRFIADAMDKLGRLDALCNIAGVLRFRHVADITPEDWDFIFAVNVRGPFFLIQAALPHLIQSEGAIVNVASASAFMGQSYLSPYAASKAALVNLTKSLAVELAHTGVHINAMAPGSIATPMAASAAFPENVDFALVARFSGLRGLSQPEDFTDLILFLASPRGKIAHGACFVADKGITAG